MSDTDTIAVFIDAENLAALSPEAGVPFDIKKLLEKLREEGTIRYAKAYGDWTRRPLSLYRNDFQDSTVEMCMLSTNFRGKNTADIQMAMDALEMALLPAAPTTMVIVSGDRDFVPLAQKIRRYGIKVIGIGLKDSASDALKKQCDRYIYYDELFPEVDGTPASPAEEQQKGAAAKGGRAASATAAAATAAPDAKPVFDLMARAGLALLARGEEVTGSRLNNMMRQLDPAYDFRRFRFNSFKTMVEAAEKAKYTKMHPREGQDFTVEICKSPAAAQPRAELIGQRKPFKDNDRLLDDYLQVLADKRVPLLPAVTRTEAVQDLWAEFAKRPEGISFGEACALLATRARERGVMPPVIALEKLLVTLGIAGCFTYAFRPVEISDSTVFVPSVTAEDACAQVDYTYIRGIVMDYPDAPLVPDAVAQLLYGDDGEESLAKAKRVISKVTHQALGNK